MDQDAQAPDATPGPADSTPPEQAGNPMLGGMPPITSRKRDYILETFAPQSVIEPPPIRISEEDRFSIGVDLMQQINQGLSDRTAYNINLDLSLALYLGHTESKEIPWPKSSNVFIPLTKEMVDTICARLASLVFQQRFVVVNGNTEDGAAAQARVERYMNAEIARHNWTDPLWTWMFQSLLYGTGVLGVFWKRKVSKRKKLHFEQKVDEETGTPLIDPISGDPIIQKVLKSEPLVEYDDVVLQPIPLKEFVVFPSWAPTIDDALGCARKVRLSEQQLNAMVRAGVCWEKEVEIVLSYHTEGIDERPEDQQGTYPVTDDGTINISGGVTNIAPYRRQRGPITAWMVHTNQYDLDKDGEFEEHVFFVHEESQRCFGHDPYKYWHGKRPYIMNTPMPNDQIIYGTSVPMSVAALQSEMNTKENQKNDAIDRALSPILIRAEGMTCLSGDNETGPDAQWSVQGISVQEAAMYLTTPEPPLSTWQEQQWLYERAMTLLGLNSPMMGAQSSGRRTAREVGAQMASAGVRLDLIANRLRQACQQMLQQVVELKIQYGPDENPTTVNQDGVPRRLMVSKQDLASDLDYNVVGAGGPLDRQARAQDMMILYTLLMRNPLVVQSMARVYGVTQMMLQEHDRPDVQALIGSMEEAQQMDQQRQQQQMQAQQVQQQMMGMAMQNPQMMMQMMGNQGKSKGKAQKPQGGSPI